MLPNIGRNPSDTTLGPPTTDRSEREVMHRALRCVLARSVLGIIAHINGSGDAESAYLTDVAGQMDLEPSVVDECFSRGAELGNHWSNQLMGD